jgi:FixJ family two-component response regulator
LYFSTIDNWWPQGGMIPCLPFGFFLSCGHAELPTNKTAATVLVVDDDMSMRRALRMQLLIAGFNVVLFQGAEALLASEIPPRDVCLLLDVYMLGMSGIELCQSMAASQSHVPTILMSGSDDQHTRQLMRQANPIASLFKPIDETVLLRAIRKALRSG